MTSSTNEPFHPIIPAPAAYVYLLHSAAAPDKYKLGLTSHPAARVESLVKSHGALDLSKSVVVAAQTRRAAFDLEGVLRTVFCAPAWRVDTGPHRSDLARPQAGNGNTEWYASHAFAPMVAFVENVILQDTDGGGSRFAVERDAQRLAAWCQRTGKDREQGSSSGDDLWLAENGANFSRLQSWIEARRSHLVEVRPADFYPEQSCSRTLVYRQPSGDDLATNEVLGDTAEQLASMCLVSYRHARGSGAITYFDGMSTEAYPSMCSIGFRIPESLERVVSDSPALGDLLAGIKAWLCHI